MKHFLAIITTIIVLTTMFSGCNYTQDNIVDVLCMYYVTHFLNYPSYIPYI